MFATDAFLHQQIGLVALDMHLGVFDDPQDTVHAHGPRRKVGAWPAPRGRVVICVRTTAIWRLLGKGMVIPAREGDLDIQRAAFAVDR